VTPQVLALARRAPAASHAWDAGVTVGGVQSGP